MSKGLFRFIIFIPFSGPNARLLINVLLLHSAAARSRARVPAAVDFTHPDSVLGLSFSRRRETFSSFLTFKSVSSVFAFGPIGDKRFLCGSAHSPSLNKL